MQKKETPTLARGWKKLAAVAVYFLGSSCYLVVFMLWILLFGCFFVFLVAVAVAFGLPQVAFGLPQVAFGLPRPVIGGEGGGAHRGLDEASEGVVEAEVLQRLR
jgi:hypothetical protein